ncbi:YqgE/AlgH family protein [Noviherbaspirillum denitrificans]|uniref:Uncharacterized protein n=1 Tax=Noviherbaspirillum denitrificans TaxID=1968433 RepID=A0A254TFP5_9BURK|nr:YqgE/AlgH family protein [Noviherbaspirillum denitrificans]OWW20152.1 hypothetical protein AYR66_12250 [Noviherbaspirillum denitrificans]
MNKPRRLLLLYVLTLFFLVPGAQAGEPAGKGILLVASKGMRDPNFRQTVLLLTDHGRQGTLGVILNRSMQTGLGHLFPGVSGLQDGQDTLYSGGPVSRQTLVFLYRAQSKANEALHVVDDIYMSMSAEILDGLLRREAPTRDLRVFQGYAGWAAGQLKAEIERGAWHVLKVDPDVVFSKAPEKLWREMINRATALEAKAQPEPVALLATHR